MQKPQQQRSRFFKDTKDITILYTFDDNDQLGSGSFAIVYKGLRIDTVKNLKTEIAVKQITIKKSNVKDIQREIEQLSIYSQNPSFLKFYNFQQTKTNIYLFTELMEDDLNRIITMRNTTTNYLSFKAIHNIFQQFLNTLKYMKISGVCHRDIKPENFMIKTQDKEDQQNYERTIIKIGDMGTSKRIDPQTGEPTEHKGTFYYQPKEIFDRSFQKLSKEEGNKCFFSQDIYSCGILLYQLVFNWHPFRSINKNQKYTQLIEYFDGKQELNLSTERQQSPELNFYISIIKQMMHRDYKQRITIEKLYDFYSAEVKKYNIV